MSAGWYPLALAGGVEAGTAHGTHLFGDEIVVWRDADGSAHVWDDRCPHRGMRLSFGFVRGGRIACLYHGWQYGADGHCVAIPAHPGLSPPATIVTERRSSSEALGMVWTGIGEAGERPAVPEEAIGLTVTPMRSIHVDGAADDVAAALTGFAIAPFHPDLGEGTRQAVRRAGPLVIATAEMGYVTEVLIVGVQPLDTGRTALHLVVAWNVGDYRGAGQRHFARIAESFRYAFETGRLPAAKAAA